MTSSLGKLKKIEFTSFRGLGVKGYTLEMKGKNCIVIGGNGKGKSCIAEGIEFLFGGSVQRFDDFDPLRNVYSNDDVCVSAADVNGNYLALTLNNSGVLSFDPVDKGAYVDYPSSDCFVLRRSRVLDFIHSKPSGRYVSFSRLLGIEVFENKRKCFEDLRLELLANKKKLEEEYRENLNAFRQDDGYIPQSFVDVLKYASAMSKGVGYEDVKSIEDCISILDKIRKSGNLDDQKKYDTLLIARQSVDQITFPLFEENVVYLKEQWDEVLVAAKEYADYKSEAIVREGIQFFEENTADTKCPLCESVIDPLVVLLRLKDRRINLENYTNKKKEYKRVLDSITAWVASTRKSISLSIENESSVFDFSTTVVLWKILRELDDILRNGIHSYADINNGDISFIFNVCDRLRIVKENCIKSICFEIDELKKKMDSKQFALHSLLFNLKNSFLNIETKEVQLAECASLLFSVDSARKAFNEAYKTTLHEIVKQFESFVYEIYKFLHDGHVEPVECTGVELAPSKGKNWLLELGICFFEKEGFCKPEYYLSEGHLDSLGLSIYLASVLSFNAKGTLVVLDDIVSSVDQEHRQRVADLLVGRFKEYQLLILTHDERWASLINSRAIAIDVQDQWKSVQITSWHPENGPMQTTFRNNWKYIDGHLTQDRYMLLGGILRKLTESFLKSILAKFQMYVYYKASNSYTIFEILDLSKTNDKNDRCKKINDIRKERGCGPAKHLRDIIRGALLLEVEEVASFSEHDAEINMMRAFGSADLLNELVHDKFYITQFMEVRDFAISLKTIEGILQKRGFCA